MCRRCTLHIGIGIEIGTIHSGISIGNGTIRIGISIGIGTIRIGIGTGNATRTICIGIGTILVWNVSTLFGNVTSSCLPSLLVLCGDDGDIGNLFICNHSHHCPNPSHTTTLQYTTSR